MNQIFFTQQQLSVFADDLHHAFLRSGFEVIEEPYIDYSLYGFRATYVRRYFMKQPTPFYEGILTTILHVVGLPFGHHGQKMVIISAPRTLDNEPISDSLKLRIHFHDNGQPFVVFGDNQTFCNKSRTLIKEQDNSSKLGLPGESFSNVKSSTSDSRLDLMGNDIFVNDLANYVAHIIEVISPGLIQLPIEMKLEILKKLSLDSIVRMSRVNSEFRSLIFNHGEPLWRHLCMRDFNIKIINRSVHRSWMQLYKETYLKELDAVCRRDRALPGLPERPALPPVPYRFQIEWLPEVLNLRNELGPLDEIGHRNNNQLPFALEFNPLRRADSLDSFL